MKSLKIHLYTKPGQIFVDAAICGIAWCAAYLVRFGVPIPPAASRQMLLLLPLVAVQILISASFGTYQRSWRYVNAADALSLVRAYLIYAAALLAVALLAGPYLALLHVPTGVTVSLFLLSTLGALAVRLAHRMHYEYERHSGTVDGAIARRFLIIGAGLHGITVAREMLLRKGIEVLGFLDDDPKKQGLTIASVPVLGPVSRLPEIAKALDVDEVVVCISPQSRRLLHLEEAKTKRGLPLPSRIMPTLEEILRGEDPAAVQLSGKGIPRANGFGNAQDAGGDKAPADISAAAPFSSSLSTADAKRLSPFAKTSKSRTFPVVPDPAAESPVRNKSILITGGAGFIGSSLAEKLVAHNRVILFDQSFAHGPIQYTPLAHHPNVTRIEGDILDADLGALVKQAEVIIHAAAMLGVSRVCNSARKTLETNYVGTSRLLRALDRNPAIERFIYFSTSEVFGVNSFRVDETSHPHIGPIAESRWSYAMSKLAGEHLVASYFRETRLPIAIVRPFNIFGPRRTGDYALRRFITNALRNEPLEVYGDGTQIRSWCYIEDFCLGLTQMIVRPEAIGEDFNIGSPRNISTVLELARKVIELSGSRSTVVFRESPFPDISIRVPSLDKAKRLLGYEPRFDLDTGLRLTIDWHRENLDPLQLSVSPTQTGNKVAIQERVSV